MAERFRLEHPLWLVTLGGLAVVVAAIGIFAAHFWPSPAANAAPSSGNGVPPAYQGTWNGNVPIPMMNDSIQLSLRLGPGGIDKVVGSIFSSTFDCGANVTLVGGSGPVSLRLAAYGSGTCPFLKYFDAATATLTSSDELEFNVDVFDMSVACDLRN